MKPVDLSKESRSAKNNKKSQTYFLILAAAVGTILVSVVMHRLLVGTYSDTVATNQGWSNRMAQYVELVSKAAAVKSPCNDAIQSAATDKEEARMQQALAAFNTHLAKLEQDLHAETVRYEEYPNVDIREDVARLPQGLNTVRQSMSAMAEEATQLLANVQKNQTTLAGQRLATVERIYGEVNRAIDNLCRNVAQIQNQIFAEEIASTASAKRVEYGIAVLVLLIVIAAVWYGRQFKLGLEDVGHRENELLAALRQARSELTLANNSIVDSEGKFRWMLDTLDDGYYEVDLQGNTLYCNSSFAKLLGYPAEEIRGLNPQSYMSEEWAKSLHAGFEEVYESGEPKRNFTYEIIRKDGERRFVEASISLIKKRGEPRGFNGLVRDVTERLQTQAAFEKSLNEFLVIASQVSEGDLTKRAAGGDQTLGQIIAAVNKMLDDFSAMLREVKQIGLSVSSSATEILAASEQIAVGSQRQADEITNTSSAVEEMAASMIQVSKNAESSVRAARRALNIADEGDRSVRFTAEAMTRIESAVLETADKMRGLSARSSEISEIINLINEIAAQTNLLALNAAIEAAHAGQAGLGFSVVADEIRKLAERTSRATKDVGSLIKAVQGEIGGAVRAMESGCEEVRRGTHVAGEASGALKEIGSAVRQSAELMEEISAASDEQARITGNLAEAMQTISGITLETSAGAHETTQTLQGMVELAEQLNGAISAFRIGQEYVHPFSYDGGLPPPTNGGQRRGHPLQR